MLPTYEDLLSDLRGLFHGEADPVANAANTAAALWQHIPEINWAGFYFLKAGELVLGPFHGKPACVRIAMGAGVCGTAAQQRRTIIVPDVHAFPGHIACDPSSRAEIVVPIIQGSKLLGVIDVDSPVMNRFGVSDSDGLEAVAAAYVASLC